MSKLNYISACIFVKDIRHAEEFYTDILQQKIKYDFGKNIVLENGLSLWEISEGHEIQNTSPSGKLTEGFELYFETDSIEAICDLIENNKIRKLHGLKEEAWGQRTIRFYDPDGHLIEIGEAMPVFVSRMLETMSEEAVSGKTGISVEDIRTILRSGE